MGRQDEMHPAEAVDTRLTYDDYLHFPPDGKRHEIIDGEHYVTPAPSTRHQRISRRLVTAMDVYFRDHPLGEVLNAPLDVILSDFDVVQPDVVFVSNERTDIAEDGIRGAPDLAIEILSPSSRRTDEVAKRKLFERVGVREYLDCRSGARPGEDLPPRGREIRPDSRTLARGGTRGPDSPYFSR